MRVTVTGATGLIGSRLVARLLERGDEVTVLSRDPNVARTDVAYIERSLEHGTSESRGRFEVAGWSPADGPAPAEALAGRDGVVHLAGEPVAQRWTDEARARIRTSREAGTRNLVAGLRSADPRPGVLVCASAVGWYGDRGEDPLDEEQPPGDDFLATVVRQWESQARKAAELGVRVVLVRTGVVLDRGGGALAKMLPFFRAGIGGPVAGGRQWMPWIHTDDVAGIYLAALDGTTWEGPINATAPQPVRNRDFSRALGRALRRPAFAPVPAFALRALYGDMAEIVTASQRAIPTRPQQLGYTFAHADLDEALRHALSSS